ncbi:MAG: cytidine deaminase [Clostridia bacterium]|nr:cytidine deaminase [Clostridia bacterium]
MQLNKEDLELIDIARNVLKENSDLYSDKNTIVASVVKASSGKIYKGINIKTSHSICSEQVALGQALACGERKIDTIVAVKWNLDGTTRVVSPCGLCRYTFDKLELDTNVIVEDVEKDIVLKVKATELLPYPYKRDNI